MKGDSIPLNLSDSKEKIGENIRRLAKLNPEIKFIGYYSYLTVINAFRENDIQNFDLSTKPKWSEAFDNLEDAMRDIREESENGKEFEGEIWNAYIREYYPNKWQKFLKWSEKFENRIVLLVLILISIMIPYVIFFM